MLMVARSFSVSVTPPLKVLVRVPTRLAITNAPLDTGVPRTRIGSLNCGPMSTAFFGNVSDGHRHGALKSVIAMPCTIIREPL